MLIYSGCFEMGYFHGYGKLQYHEAFEYLFGGLKKVKKINKRVNYCDESSLEERSWTAYFGEFNKGKVTGFG